MTEPDIDQQTADTTEAMPEMHTADALRFALGMFADLAWIQMGIRANPSTGKVTVNLPDARLAIDAINALVQLTEGRFDPHEVRDLRNLLTSLQMNYAQRVSAGG